ncbi:VOC family protein [Flavobacterium sp. DGU11]|uniref:VOC family protein n=1 Tax=Flavobacterium arundinis TaxID=3139143 RepID=A0ABU9HY31_9FLAO
MTIIEIELLSDDLSETTRFYKKVLGLDPFAKEKDLVMFRFGATKLIFRKSENIRPVYHFAIDVPNNRFEEAYRMMKWRTEIISGGPAGDIVDFTNWDAKSFYFLDNNGNILEFITRYSNKTFSNYPFSSNSYINISEIGLVTNNVTELADTLVKEYGLPIFHRQPRGDNFMVVGDDDGLLILGSKGREWYPTKFLSRSFRTRVLFFHGGNVGHIVR